MAVNLKPKQVFSTGIADKDALGKICLLLTGYTSINLKDSPGCAIEVLDPGSGRYRISPACEYQEISCCNPPKINCADGSSYAASNPQCCPTGYWQEKSGCKKHKASNN